MVNGSDIVEYAKQFIGVPYVWGGTTPSGFDCSGLVQYVYRHFGINISRTTKTQINDGREVDRNHLQLGDLVFPTNGHVTLYIGNGQVLHAPQPGDRVKFLKCGLSGGQEEFYQMNQIDNMVIVIVVHLEFHPENLLFIQVHAYIEHQIILSF